MDRYLKMKVGFIRGINVGGKNIVSMKELKNNFDELKYDNIKTIGNTGVIIFGVSEKQEKFLTRI